MSPTDLARLDLRAPEAWAQSRRKALVVGGVATALMAVGFFLNREQFLRSWLLGWMFWVGLGLGCLGLLMLQYLTGGAWGMVIRRLLEAGTRTIWLLAVLGLPIFIGVKVLYVWAQPEHMDEVLRAKAGYLNVPFFLARAAVYFGLWIGLTTLLNKWSTSLDEPSVHYAVEKKIKTLAGPGLCLFILSVAFAAIDWVMSLEPHWFSTIFGLMWLISLVLTAHSFTIAVLYFLTQRGRPMGVLVNKHHFHDLAKLLFAFVMVWAYFSFSQYLIIWSGNLPEEITWYVTRLSHGWEWFGVSLLVFQFAVPFLLLMPRSFNFNASLVLKIAGLILVMRLVDLFWMTAPAFHPKALSIHWMDFVAPVAIGGWWVSEYLRQLATRPLLMVGASGLEEALQHGGH
ncbi:MAG: hypothetical protein IPK07_30335 [Deltaproteobacteria bacterium]|nr:hypothetical protein [Deltaproteobacteria bacterium]